MNKKTQRYFSNGEIGLWIGSVVFIVSAFLLFDGENVLTLFASLIGCTSLIFLAKGNPIGQALMIVFSIIYGVISFSFSYYGEMITYLGMTLPMAVSSLISWIKNPYNGNKSEVKVAEVTKNKIVAMIIMTVAVTIAFYYILGYFNTKNLIVSTISVATSFAAAYLTFCRSPYYALAYAVNDIVLIVLWIMASVENVKYISVVICFIVFLINDVYGFVSWSKMKKRQILK